MFDFVRKHTRLLQLLLLILILPSFVVFGLQGYSSFSGDEGVVAKVGKQSITQAEWDNAHRNFIERVRSQQPNVDVSQFDTPEARRQSLDALVRQYVLAEAAADQSLSVSDNRLLRQFTTDPPGTHREPITRSASPRAASRSGSCSGWCEPSASISTRTRKPRTSPQPKPAR